MGKPATCGNRKLPTHGGAPFGHPHTQRTGLRPPAEMARPLCLLLSLHYLLRPCWHFLYGYWTGLPAVPIWLKVRASISPDAGVYSGKPAAHRVLPPTGPSVHNPLDGRLWTHLRWSR